MISISSLLKKLIIVIITIQAHIGCKNGSIPYNSDGSWKFSIQKNLNLFYPNFCFMTKLSYKSSCTQNDSDFYPLLFCINFEIFLNMGNNIGQKVPYFKLNKIFIAKIIKTDSFSKDSNFDPKVLENTKSDSPYESEDELLNDNFQFLVYQNFGEDSYSEKYHQIDFDDPEYLLYSSFSFERKKYIEDIRFLVFGLKFIFINEFSLSEYYGQKLYERNLNNEDLENIHEESFNTKKLNFRFDLSYYDFRMNDWISNGFNEELLPNDMKIFPLFSKEMAGALIKKFEAFKSSTKSHISSEIDPDSKIKKLFRLPNENEKSDLVRDLKSLFNRSKCFDSLSKIDYIKLPKKNSQVDSKCENEENKYNSEENEKINNNNSKGKNGNKNKDEGKASLGKKIFMIVIFFSTFIILMGSFYYFYSKKTVVKL